MKRQPDEKYETGACSVSMWQNQAKFRGGKPYWTVAPQKSYRDEQGKWQHDCNFKVDEVPKVLLLLSKAFEYAMELKEETL